MGGYGWMNERTIFCPLFIHPPTHPPTHSFTSPLSAAISLPYPALYGWVRCSYMGLF